MYTSTMEDIARGALAGLAIGGFTVLMLNANMLAVKMLWRVNRLAIETVFEMRQGLIRVDEAREMKITRQRIIDELKSES